MSYRPITFCKCILCCYYDPSETKCCEKMDVVSTVENLIFMMKYIFKNNKHICIATEQSAWLYIPITIFNQIILLIIKFPIIHSKLMSNMYVFLHIHSIILDTHLFCFAITTCNVNAKFYRELQDIVKTSTTPSCSGPIPAQKSRGNSVLGVVFSHTMPKMDFRYSHRFSLEKIH